MHWSLNVSYVGLVGGVQTAYTFADFLSILEKVILKSPAVFVVSVCLSLWSFSFYLPLYIHSEFLIGSIELGLFKIKSHHICLLLGLFLIPLTD